MIAKYDSISSVEVKKICDGQLQAKLPITVRKNLELDSLHAPLKKYAPLIHMYVFFMYLRLS